MKPAALSITLRDAFVFIVPALFSVNIQFVGRLYLSELLLLAALPFVITEQRFSRANSWSTSVVTAGLLWLWALIVTDLYRSTAFVDLAKGWLNVAFTLVDVVVIIMLIAGQRRRIILFAAGLAVGYAAQYRFNPTPYAEVDHWKFGVALPVTLLIVLFSCRAAGYRIPLFSSISLLFAGVLNLAFGFRSLGGVCLLAGVYLAAQAFSRRHGSVRVTPLRLVFVCLIGVAVAASLITAYGHAARDGFLGAPAAQKYGEESGGRFGVLLGGRPEFLVSSKAIADSPLIGHGSWAKDPKYTNGLLSVLYRNGYQPSGALLYSIRHSGYLIPSHSFLFQSWVEAGLLGAVFWFLVLALTLSTLIIAFKERPLLSPLLAFLSVLLVWNILFSPYGGDQRIVAMFSVAVLLTYQRLPAEIRRATPADDQLRVDRSERTISHAPVW